MTPVQADNLRLEPQADGIATLWLDVPGRIVNVFNRQVFADLDAVLDRIASEPAIRVLVIRSAKPAGFLAGADLHEFAAIKSAADAWALSANGQRLFDKLANLTVPTLAVIHGPCLGGGLEFALACDYRLVIDHPKTLIGLPEIELGILPAWGGTQRLPRVVGLERALQVIIGSRRLGARDALRWKLAAFTANEPGLPTVLEALIPLVASQGKRLKKELPRYTWRQTILESNFLGRRVLFGGTERLLRRRVPDDMPAPKEALEAVRVGMAQGMEAGLAYEREAVGRLALTPACRNLVGLFFQREEARKLPAELRDDKRMSVRRLGIVGAGAMGAGIAQLAAIRGLEVVIKEVNDEALGAGMFKIAALFQKAVERRLLSEEDAKHKISAIRGGTTWQGFDDVDLVIEAAVEELEAKQAIFRELDRRTRATSVLATNTSSLTVKSLQEGLRHPERVAGLHFFNPVHKMPLVEVARTDATSTDTVAILTRLAVSLGKTPVVVKDRPGFVVNRILMPYLNESVLQVAEGLTIAHVDAVMVRFGMPMGPLELLDQVGLDVAAHIAGTMQPLLSGRFPPNPAFELMRAKGWLGHKSGVGFYRHQGNKKRVNVLAQNALRATQQVDDRALITALPAAVRSQQARERMVLLMVNEAALCLGEGLAGSASAIDLAMVLGTGWAPHRGGPLRYADDRGHADVAVALANLAQRVGPRFEPCAELRHAGAFHSRSLAPERET
jgi:3-hydroxyacyl-CoA dehydrogenase/enoyl-CoA hydratase/3-hydroxybutyryl-CoA epimerase